MAINLTAILNLQNNMTRPLRQAQNNLNSTRTTAGALASQLGIVASAAGAVAVAFASVNKAMSFEAQMSSIKALTGASAAEMQKMTDLAMEMGASTKYSALEAAAGIEELLKAGITPAQVQAGALEAALNLATAGGLDLAKASEIMSTALNAYKDDAMSAADASNILAGTANASATSVEELQYGLSQVSAVASGVGLSFKDTNIALGLFANNGLKGSDGGTSLKTMLSNLSPMTEAASEQMSELGLMTEKGTSAFYDAQGEIKSMAEIAGLLQNSMKDLNSEQRQQAMYTMFGSDAIRAGNILYKEGAEGVKKFQEEMSKVTALDVAKEKMNNAQGAIEQFSGAMETMQIAVMMPLLPLIKDVATELANFVGGIDPAKFEEFGLKIKAAVSSAYQVVKAFAIFVYDHWAIIKPIIIGVTAAFVAMKVITTTLAIIGTAIKVFKALKTAITIVRTAFTLLRLTMLLFPGAWIIVAIGAVVTAAIWLYKNWDTVKEKTRQLWAKLGEFKGVAVIVLGPLGLLIRAAVDLAENWDNTKGVWANVWGSIKRTAEDAVNEVIGSINKMITKLNSLPLIKIPLISEVDFSGPTRDLSKVSKQLAAEPVKQGFQRPSPFRGEPISFPSGNIPGHYQGLDNVRKNGQIVRVHRGERIMNAAENKEYSSGNGKSVINLSITYNGSAISDQEFDRFGGFVLRKLQSAQAGGA